MQYLYRPNECQMTFQEAGARQVYGIDCYRRDRERRAAGGAVPGRLH